MFFLNFHNIWTLLFFFLFTYSTFITTTVIYSLPILITNTLGRFKNKSSQNLNFLFLSGFELFLFLVLPGVCFYFILSFWVAPIVSAWFGHLVFTGFQYKITLFISVNFFLVLYIILSFCYFSSKEIYDFFIVKFYFFYWMIFLFLSNSFFTTIFVIEVLSTLIFMLLITSTFSTTFFYKNIHFTKYNFFQNSIPFNFFQSILFFFWMSLLSSLNLFIFLLFFYFKFTTFDWYLVEHLFFFFLQVSTFQEVYSLSLVWFVLLFCIFLKCGIVPLFLWKPTFFKGLSFTALYFYICFFYFFIFLFLIVFLNIYFYELFYYFYFITFSFVLIGIGVLLFIICETFFLKTFFAVSSIINSLFVILAMLVSHQTSFIFLL